MGRGDLPSKPCAVCGRTITWRRKWARDWEEVRYCSKACRRRRQGDPRLEAAILDLLASRGRGKSICPSEAARRVAAEDSDRSADDWRALVEPAREAARRLVARGEVVITQGGRVVDPSTARGPVRIRRA